ncbi:MAG: hypothetical protein OCC46_07725 [Pseudodesulfovibrio sp.]
MAKALTDFINEQKGRNPHLATVFTDRRLKGFTHQVTKILAFAKDKPLGEPFSHDGTEHIRIVDPSFHDNHIEQHVRSYHIHSDLLKKYKRNPIGKHFEHWFKESPNSGYHINNAGSGKKSNGYTKWYYLGVDLIDIIDTANTLFMNALKFQKHGYEHVNIDESIGAIPFVEPDFQMDTKKYFKVKWELFLHEVELFNEHDNPQGLYLLRQMLFQDEEFVYLNNFIHDESLDGKGRTYSVLGSLDSDIRERLLPGYVELDINASLQSTLLSLVALNTLKPWKEVDYARFKSALPLLHKLTGTDLEKKLFRHSFASAFGVPVKKVHKRDVDAKTIITHLTMAPKSNYLYKYCKDKGPKRVALAKRCAEPFIKECLILRKIILDKFYYCKTDENRNYKIGNLYIRDIPGMVDEQIRIDNLKLKGKGRGKVKEDRIMARIYELVEHEMRKEIVTYMESKGVDEIYQVHDCVIFPQQNTEGKLTKVMIAKRVFDKLKMRISLSVETYDQPTQKAA